MKEVGQSGSQKARVEVNSVPFQRGMVGKPEPAARDSQKALGSSGRKAGKS